VVETQIDEQKSYLSSAKRSDTLKEMELPGNAKNSRVEVEPVSSTRVAFQSSAIRDLSIPNGVQARVVIEIHGSREIVFQSSTSVGAGRRKQNSKVHALGMLCFQGTSSQDPVPVNVEPFPLSQSDVHGFMPPT